MSYYGGPQFPPQGYVIRPRGNSAAIKWMLVIIGILLALLAGFYTIYKIGDETGTAALATGALLAMLPIPLYILFILWIDRYESEPLWLLAMAFVWGATIAAFSAFTINSLISKSLAQSYDRATAFYFTAFVSAPFVEEFSKGLLLFILFWWKKDEFDGVVDGIVYAGMIGLGFAMTENFEYYGLAAKMGGNTLTAFFILRGIMSPFAHPLFTSMTGIALGLARQSNSKAVRYSMPLVGLPAAMLLHSIWNRAAFSKGFIIIYILFMLPIFAGAITAIVFALRREGRIVREHLWCDCQRGLFTFAEYDRLCNIRGRLDASYRALKWGGVRLWRARMRFNQIASELAFHRSRVQRGMIADPHTADERERAYLNHLSELRRRLGQF